MKRHEDLQAQIMAMSQASPMEWLSLALELCRVLLLEAQQILPDIPEEKLHIGLLGASETAKAVDTIIASLLHSPALDNLERLVSKAQTASIRRQEILPHAETVANAYADVLKQENELVCTEKEIQEMQQRIIRLETIRQNSSEDNLLAMSEKVVVLERDIETKKSEFERTEHRIQELHNARIQLSDALQKQKLETDGISKDWFSQLETVIHVLERQWEQLDKRLTNRNKELARLHKDCVELILRFEEIEKEFAKITSIHESNRTQFDHHFRENEFVLKALAMSENHSITATISKNLTVLRTKLAEDLAEYDRQLRSVLEWQADLSENVQRTNFGDAHP